MSLHANGLSSWISINNKLLKFLKHAPLIEIPVRWLHHQHYQPVLHSHQPTSHTTHLHHIRCSHQQHRTVLHHLQYHMYLVHQCPCPKYTTKHGRQAISGYIRTLWYSYISHETHTQQLTIITFIAISPTLSIQLHHTLNQLTANHCCHITVVLFMDTSPTIFRILDTLPTRWTVCLTTFTLTLGEMPCRQTLQ